MSGVSGSEFNRAVQVARLASTRENEELDLLRGFVWQFSWSPQLAGVVSALLGEDPILSFDEREMLDAVKIAAGS